MRLSILPIILGLFFLSATAKHGKNKPCNIEFVCDPQVQLAKKCDEQKMTDWVNQACKGIGADSVAFAGLTYDMKLNPIGYHAVCKCAHGNTKDDDYVISDDTGQWTKGTAMLRCSAPDVIGQFGCHQRA
ncbi:ECP5 protein [Teratosphaeria destructans]|uniref:ECP5 protein n=1 Tax=Teratosphaeria destructans TaxID=418781 RepID=A0A9W7VZX3_9PEZI|nr:ECP5 protein [Teratosphaeria destructans]